MEIEINNKTYGKQIIFIDDEDYNLIKNFSLYVWTTKRHTSMYAMFTFNRKQIRLHRFLMNPGDDEVIDHINGNALDNRKANLRITFQSKNNRNAKKRRNALSSSYKGVHFCSALKKWKAQIQYKKSKLTLGAYGTEIEAAIAYNDYARVLFEDFAILNKID